MTPIGHDDQLCFRHNARRGWMERIAMGRAVLPSPSRSGQAQDLLCGGGSLIFGAMLASLLADSKPVVIGANKELK